MHRALYHVAIACKKLVADPVERAAGVRAGIDIGENIRAPPHQTQAGTTVRQRRFFAGAIADLVHTTQRTFGDGGLGLRLVRIIVGHVLAE